MVKIIIADDHVVLREGLKELLQRVDDWDVIAEAKDGLEVVGLVERLLPDVVILDLSMPNLGGIEAISRLQHMRKAPPILVLSSRDDEYSVVEALKAGARGYVPKTSAADEVHFAVRSLLKGHSYISPTVCGGVLNIGTQNESRSPIASLTPREREVMKLLCEGRPNRDVAKVLHISPRTIDSHRANIMKKLGVNSNAELVQLAIRTGLVE